MRVESYNALNHVNLGGPNNCVDCGSSGNITNIAFGSQMRAWTFGLKVSF